MDVIAIGAAAGSGVVVSGGATIALLVHRRSRTREPVPESPHSLIRVLRTDAELHDAVRRAADFERTVATSLRVRSERYEAMMGLGGSATIAEIGGARRLGQIQPEGGAPHSA